MEEKEAQANQADTGSSQKGPVETEILNVNVEREGQQVSAKWGLHPSIKSELTADEWKELTDRGLSSRAKGSGGNGLIQQTSP
jgi:hypothetical protein